MTEIGIANIRLTPDIDARASCDGRWYSLNRTFVTNVTQDSTAFLLFESLLTKKKKKWNTYS
jgi:hypothetical protein